MATKYGTVGNDSITGTGEADTLHGGPQADPTTDIGADTILGGGGDDAIYGYGGNDVLSGELGYDRIEGGSGDDLIDLGSDGGLAMAMPATTPSSAPA